jgi:hypothetical protein
MNIRATRFEGNTVVLFMKDLVFLCQSLSRYSLASVDCFSSARKPCRNFVFGVLQVFFDGLLIDRIHVK